MAKKEEKEFSEKESELLAVISELKARLDKQDETISMLSHVADRGRIETFNSKKKKVVDSIVNVSTYNDLIVTSWRTIIDEVYKDENNVYHEDQRVELTTEDGETHVLKLVDRTRLVKKVPATVVSRTRVIQNDDGSDGEVLSENFVVRLDDGREIQLESTFIN